MAWPHEERFRGRVVLCVGLSVLALLRAGRLDGISPQQVALGALVAGAVSLVVYGYALTIGRLDARFRSVHPRKFRYASVGGFYLFSVLACVLVAGGGSLVARPAPAERMAYYLAVPCLLSAAASSRRTLAFGSAVSTSPEQAQ